MGKDHPNDNPRIFSKGCKLTTFITELFSKEYAGQILNSVPDNVKSTTTFAEAFGEAIVRFTHFGKMADDTGTTSYAMFAAFVRCMAIICRSSQKMVDIVLPVLLRRGDLLQESAMTGLLIQIKPRKAKGSVTKYEINEKALGFFPASQAEYLRPYITLVAEVGVQSPTDPLGVTEAKTKGKVTQSTKSIKGKAKPTTSKARSPPEPSTSSHRATPSVLSIPEQPKKIAHPRNLHPRYSIFACGCSDTVYNVIGPYDQYLYKSLLGNRDVLDEHPRKDEGSLSAVRMMKPFWSAGPSCYGWIDEPSLQERQAWCDDDGELFVGRYNDDETL
jgi:hypothetical protein